MRDILNKLDFLAESRGLAGRSPGDVFKKDDQTITFNEIVFYPEEGGRYTPEQLDQLLNSLGDVSWTNERSSKSGGIGVASFSDESGNELRYGRFFQEIKPSKIANAFPNEVDGFKLSTKASSKTRSNLTPQDLLDDKLNLSIANIMNQLAGKLGTNHPLYHIAHRVAVGEELPMTFKPLPDVSFSAFRDYFCEVLQPMAFINGTTIGNAKEAIDKFFDGSIAGATITFDVSKNAGLSDSLIELDDGRKIKLSSKGNKGATASTKNLLDCVEELSLTTQGQKLREKYEDIIDMLTEIRAEGQHGAPILLATKFKIIEESDAAIIPTLRNKPPINFKDIDNLDVLTPKLKSLAKSRTTKNTSSVDLYYHLLASIAFKAADAVNEKTNFSKAAAEILNNGALVQIYTKASEGKDNWTLRSFDAVYPSQEIRGVYLEPSKSYFSTGVKGNFTFYIDRGMGKPKAPSNEEGTREEDLDSADLYSVASKITGETEPDFSKGKKEPKIGREKRKK